MLRRVVRMVALPLLAVLAMTVPASPASAAERPVTKRLGHQVVHRAGAHRTAKVKSLRRRPVHKHHVPNCGGLPRSTAAQHVWIDRRGSNTAFPAHLICDAADYSVVQIKMYFITAEPGPVETFLRDVELMHRYHHVRVTFMTDRHRAHSELSGATPSARRLTPGTTWLNCASGCESPRANAVSHTKFITVSKLRSTGRPAVFTTSTNLSSEQLVSQIETGVLFSRDTPMYARFRREFAAYTACAQRRCATAARPRNWQTYDGASVYFAPTSIDPIANDLHQLDCSHGGTIDVASLWLTRQHLIQVLAAKQDQGCAVRVVVEHPEMDPAAAQMFPTRVQFQHDKYLIVHTPTRDTLYVGTEDFGPKALHDNDNVMVRTQYRGTVAAYNREFNWQWAHGAPPSTPQAHAIVRKARAVDSDS